MSEHKPLTEDDLIFAPADIPRLADLDDDEDHVEDVEVEPAPDPEPVESEALIKRKFNAKLKEIEGGASNRDDKTLSEVELATDWMQTEPADRYLHSDGVGWRRYEFGRWRDGGHGIYQDITGYIRGRVEATSAARTLNKHSVVRSAMAHVEEHRAVAADSFDADAMLVAFPDGTVLDVNTWTLRKAKREDRISKTLAASPADEPSSAWATFLYESLSHYPEDRRDEIAAYLQEMLGVALTGDCRDETFLFLWGTRGAGKGTFSETVCAMMGDYGTTLSGERVAGDHPQHRQWIAGLQGKRFALINELPERGRWRSEDLNKLVSGEYIEGNMMRQNSFTFRSQAHLLIVGNTQPTASAASGIWRRLRQVEFRHTPEHPDRQLKERLLADLPGIVAWCVEGLARWADRGHLPEAPQDIQEGVQRYENAADPVASFVAERTSPSPGHRIEVNDLYESYVAHFRAENGHEADIYPKQRTFARRITDLWGEPLKSNDKRYRMNRVLNLEEKPIHIVQSAFEGLEPEVQTP